MKGSFFNKSVNVQLNVKKQSDDENSENDIVDVNLDQKSKQFFNKVDQANQLGKSILSNPLSSLKNEKLDQIKNSGISKDLQNLEDNAQNQMKSTIKGVNDLNKSVQGNLSDLGNTSKYINKNAEDIMNKEIGGLNDAIKKGENQINSSIKDTQQQIGSMNPFSQASSSAIKGLNGLGKSMNDKVKNAEDSMKNGINKEFNGINDAMKNTENQINNQFNDTAQQIGSMNPFQQNNMNNLSGLGNSSISMNLNKSPIKGLSGMGKSMNDKIKNVDDNVKNGIKGVQDVGGSFNDSMRYTDNQLNNSINDAARQAGSINPFMQSNHLSGLGSNIERNINASNQYQYNMTNFSRGLEGDISINSGPNLDQSIKNPNQSQMNKLRPNPVQTNQSDMVLAAKQNKNVFQSSSIIHNTLQQVNNNPNINNNSVIQVYDQNIKKVKGDGGGIMKQLPWILLAIIGLWTFVFMVSDIIDYKNWKFISENSLTNVMDWHSSNIEMQKAALAYTGGMGRNYISLIDFILFYFITQVFYNLWLTNDYLEVGPIKNSIMILLFFKDLAVIILSLTSGDYDSPSGWDGFGYFWLKTFGKISIILSLSKLFFFRLNYFKTFTDNKDGCSGILRNWGISLYNWGSLNNRNPEFMISLAIFFIYLPLVLHCVVGIIESTYILIIWIAILFFLQQVIQLLFEICKPRQDEKTLTQRLLERQKSRINEAMDKFWLYFTLLYVIIPGVASVSFGNNFKESIRFHFTGQQLIFSFFTFPSSGSSYQNTMTFMCNILSLF